MTEEVHKTFVTTFAKNVVIFSIDNSSSIHNLKNSFLVLGEEPTDDINDIVATGEQKVVLIH